MGAALSHGPGPQTQVRETGCTEQHPSRSASRLWMHCGQLPRKSAATAQTFPTAILPWTLRTEVKWTLPPLGVFLLGIWSLPKDRVHTNVGVGVGGLGSGHANTCSCHVLFAAGLYLKRHFRRHKCFTFGLLGQGQCQPAHVHTELACNTAVSAAKATVWNRTNN